MTAVIDYKQVSELVLLTCSPPHEGFMELNEYNKKKSHSFKLLPLSATLNVLLNMKGRPLYRLFHSL